MEGALLMSFLCSPELAFNICKVKFKKWACITELRTSFGVDGHKVADVLE